MRIKEAVIGSLLFLHLTVTKIGGDILFILLLLILALISLACFSESKVPRKGSKLFLSVGAAMILSVLMEAVTYMFVERHLMEGLIVVIVYFLMPLIAFIPAQLLLFDIKLFHRE